MRERWWKTAGGVVVREIDREQVFRNRTGRLEMKVACQKQTGGFHGWLWLRNLIRVDWKKESKP